MNTFANNITFSKNNYFIQSPSHYGQTLNHWGQKPMFWNTSSGDDYLYPTANRGFRDVNVSSNHHRGLGDYGLYDQDYRYDGPFFY